MSNTHHNRHGHLGEAGTKHPGKPDGINVQEKLKRRVPTLQDVPRFLRGRLREAYVLALEGIREAYATHGTAQAKVRSWMLLILGVVSPG